MGYKQTNRTNYDISNFLIRIINGVGEFRLAVKLHDFIYILFLLALVSHCQNYEFWKKLADDNKSMKN